MSIIPYFSSFLSDQVSPSVLWCYTGGGHFFKEIFDQITKINRESIPICFLFSNAGALVANRYGFFWKIKQSDFRKKFVHFIFEDVVAHYNIKDVLQEANFSYSILSKDPTYSAAMALANSECGCIIASPLTANTASKLVLGIADSMISNLLASGLKSGKKIGILPTDATPKRIKTKLPIRQNCPASSDQVNIAVCKFNALKETPTNTIQFLPQFCVGCQMCVERFPGVFSYGDEIEMKIREVDSYNIKKLSTELTVFRSPYEIFPFIKQKCK
ncbi:MAG: flavoprotein [Candidatus Hodarchaeota archaeon]